MPWGRLPRHWSARCEVLAAPIGSPFPTRKRRSMS